MKNRTYQLSQAGREYTFAHWKKMGGCGIPHDTLATLALGPIAHWCPETTLGQIEDTCAYTGRVFARFAVEHLGAPNMSRPYEGIDQARAAIAKATKGEEGR